jgi:hypothetical protein
MVADPARIAEKIGTPNFLLLNHNLREELGVLILYRLCDKFNIMNTLLFLVVVSCLAQALAFVAPKATRGATPLKGGTRTMEEVGKSKKALFRDIRSKLDKAADTPGFFEVGEGPPEIELFCKSNGDGTQIGDCPYAQFIQVRTYCDVCVYAIGWIDNVYA